MRKEQLNICSRDLIRFAFKLFLIGVIIGGFVAYKQA